jgi:hypothetical protein
LEEEPKIIAITNRKALIDPYRETFAERHKSCNMVIPRLALPRPKPMGEGGTGGSSVFKDFLDSGSLAQTGVKECMFYTFATIS